MSQKQRFAALFALIAMVIVASLGGDSVSAKGSYKDYLKCRRQALYASQTTTMEAYREYTNTYYQNMKQKRTDYNVAYRLETSKERSAAFKQAKDRYNKERTAMKSDYSTTKSIASKDYSAAKKVCKDKRENDDDSDGISGGGDCRQACSQLDCANCGVLPSGNCGCFAIDGDKECNAKCSTMDCAAHCGLHSDGSCGCYLIDGGGVRRL